nr:hypothetical protein [Actinomadura madurae]
MAYQRRSWPSAPSTVKRASSSPGVGGGEGRRGGGDVGDGVRVVDVAGGDQPPRDGRGDPDEGAVAVRQVGVAAGAGDLVVGDLGGEHHPAARGGRVGGEQAQRGAGGGGHRRVLQLLQVAARVPLAERGRDGVRGERRGADLPRGVDAGEQRERGRQVDAHDGQQVCQTVRAGAPARAVP